MALITFSFFHWKYLFLARLVHKIKIVKFSWNWVSTLIRICRIQSWFSFFCLKPDVPFLGKFSLNNKILNLTWNLVLRLIRIWRIQWWCLFFFQFLTRSILFLVNLFQKIKLACWSWNLEPWIIQICRLRWWFSFFFFFFFFRSETRF